MPIAKVHVTGVPATALRKVTTCNHCDNSPAELIRAVESFEARVNADQQTLFERMTIKSSLDPDQEKLHVS